MYPTFSSLARMWGRWIPEVAVDILVKQRGCFLRSVVIHVGIQLALFFFQRQTLGQHPPPHPRPLPCVGWHLAECKAEDATAPAPGPGRTLLSVCRLLARTAGFKKLPFPVIILRCRTMGKPFGKLFS